MIDIAKLTGTVKRLGERGLSHVPAPLRAMLFSPPTGPAAEPAPPPPVEDLIRAWHDPAFIAGLKPAEGRTLLDLDALYILLQLVEGCARLPGNVAEFGVYKGGSAYLMAQRLAACAPEKQIFLFDTFGGMPETDPEKDIHRKGVFADTSAESVRTYLRGFPSVSIHQGLFAERFPDIAGERFCFVHIDCDIYASVRECCEFLYPHMVPGGVMLFDDYGMRSCPGAKLAVDEFFQDKRELPVRLTTSQCVLHILPRA